MGFLPTSFTMFHLLVAFFFFFFFFRKLSFDSLVTYFGVEGFECRFAVHKKAWILGGDHGLTFLDILRGPKQVR